MDVSWNLLLLLCVLPNPLSAVNFTVFGLYTVHNADAGMECDSLVPTNAILTFFHQRFVAAANKRLADYGIQLNTRIADSCDDPSVTLRELVKHGHMGDRCHDKVELDAEESLLAVTGAFSSEIGDNVNNLLRAFCIPVVESVSSSLSLDNPTRYPYFVRTSPSDIYRTQAILSLLQSQQFVHVSVIYDGSDFGSSMYNQFKQITEGCQMPGDLFQNPCIEGAYEIDFHKKTTRNKVEEQLLDLKIALKQSSVKVYVIFMKTEATELLFLYLTFWGYRSGDLIYVFAHNHEILSDLTEFSFAVYDHIDSYAKAETIFASESDTDLAYITNDYMKELIMMQNACCMDMSEDCGYSMQCTGDERVSQLDDYDMKQIRLVYNSINLISNSLIALHEKMCPNEKKECEAMTSKVTGKVFLQQMMQTKFTDDEGIEFRLYNRSGRPSFDIVQRQNGTWQPILLDYDPFIGPQVRANLTEVLYPPKWNEIEQENANCRTFCHQSIVVPRGSCCWECAECPGNNMYIEHPMQVCRFRDVLIDEAVFRDQQCKNCSTGEIPNEFRNACIPEPKPPLFYPPHTEMYVLFGFSGFGALLCVIAGVVIFRHSTTPMVRASTPDLCYFMVANLCLMFGVSGLMMPSSSLAICASAWCVSTILLCQTHALFLVKAIRLARVPFFLRIVAVLRSPARASILLCGVFLLFQALVTTMWILLRPPVIIRLESGHRLCSSNSEVQTIVLLLIPLILLILTFLFQKIAGRNRVLFQVRQARLGLAGSLCFIVNYAVLLPLLFLQDQDQTFRAIIFMCIPLLTSFVAYITMLLPVIWELTFHADVNKHEYVARERSRQFRRGNVMYYIDAIVMRRHRSSTAASTGVVVEKRKVDRATKSMPNNVPRPSHDSVLRHL